MTGPTRPTRLHDADDPPPEGVRVGPARTAGDGDPGGVQAVLDDYWTHRAPAYDAYQYRAGRTEEDLRVWSGVFARALPQPPARVLDVGTGSGYVALVLARSGYQVTGVDSAQGMLEIARTHARQLLGAGSVGIAPTFVHGDAVSPPVARASFDAVTSRYLMWTLREPARALARWRELLVPGGVLALVDAPWFPERFTEDTPGFAEHYARADVEAALPLAHQRSLDGLAQMVSDAGYEDVSVMSLVDVHALDCAYGAAPGHEVTLQHIVTGRRPA